MVEWYTYSCPECRAEFVVDETARADLIGVGCVRCGAAVTAGAFSRRGSAPTAVV